MPRQRKRARTAYKPRRVYKRKGKAMRGFGAYTRRRTGKKGTQPSYWDRFKTGVKEWAPTIASLGGLALAGGAYYHHYHYKKGPLGSNRPITWKNTKSNAKNFVRKYAPFSIRKNLPPTWTTEKWREPERFPPMEFIHVPGYKFGKPMAISEAYVPPPPEHTALMVQEKAPLFTNFPKYDASGFYPMQETYGHKRKLEADVIGGQPNVYYIKPDRGRVADLAKVKNKEPLRHDFIPTTNSKKYIKGHFYETFAKKYAKHPELHPRNLNWKRPAYITLDRKRPLKKYRSGGTVF